MRKQLAVFYKKGTAHVFEANLDDTKLTFHLDGEQIVDDQKGSSWNIFGQALSGPLAPRQLNPIVHGNHFWFSWVVFKPDTIIYPGSGGP